MAFNPGPRKGLAVPKGKPQRNGPSGLQPLPCFSRPLTLSKSGNL